MLGFRGFQPKKSPLARTERNEIVQAVVTHFGLTIWSVRKRRLQGGQSLAQRVGVILVCILIRKGATEKDIAEVLSIRQTSKAAHGVVVRARKKLATDPKLLGEVQTIEGEIFFDQCAEPAEQVIQISKFDLRIVSQVFCRKFNTTLRDLRFGRRSGKRDELRARFYFLLKRLTGESFPKIGRYVHRHHSSLVVKYHKFNTRYEEDTQFREEIDAFIKEVEDAQRSRES